MPDAQTVPVTEFEPVSATPLDQIPVRVNKLRATFLTHKTRSLTWRKNQLKQLIYAMHDRRDRINAAMQADLGRSPAENTFVEVIPTQKMIVDTLNYLDQWAKDEKAWAGMQWATHNLRVKKEPKGTVAIIGTWNWPILLTLLPLGQAVAAGNTVVLKPSEVANHTERKVTLLIQDYMDPEAVCVINGGVPETTALLDQRFEHILYTGNAHVGQIVQAKAAKWLCPVTLELGGKSPVWIDPSANLDITTKRLLWAKSLNAGQTCCAPDYILTTPATVPKLIDALKLTAKQFWSSESQDAFPEKSIMNERQMDRLANLLEQTKGSVVLGGTTDQSHLRMELTVIKDVAADDVLMQSEIFGPIIPIVTVNSIDEAIEFINARDQPLALYTFGDFSKTRKLVDLTRSGAVVEGDLMIQGMINTLPFGGTGPSGHGCYHGKYGFNLFSHDRAVVQAPQTGFWGWIVERFMSFRYPPFTDDDLKTGERILGSTNPSFARPVRPHAHQADGMGL